MGINITTEQKWNIKRAVFLAAILILFIAISAACANQYREHRNEKAREASQRVAEQKEKQRLEAINKSKQDALIARLVSICLKSQARYDASPVKERGPEVRPNCTVVTD